METDWIFQPTSPVDNLPTLQLPAPNCSQHHFNLLYATPSYTTQPASPPLKAPESPQVFICPTVLTIGNQQLSSDWLQHPPRRSKCKLQGSPRKPEDSHKVLLPIQNTRIRKEQNTQESTSQTEDNLQNSFDASLKEQYTYFSDKVKEVKQAMRENPDKSFTCLSCSGIIADGRASFLRHVIRFHLGSSPFKCCFCGQKFSRVDSLQRHFNRCMYVKEQ